MKALLLIHQYTQAFGPRFFRWSALIKQLRDQGLEFDIVDCWGHTRQAREMATGGTSKSSVAKFLIPIGKRLVFPDKSIRYLPRFLHTAEKLIQQHRPQCLIATGLPVTPLLAGALLKRKHPELKFIAEYGDPYYFNSNYRNSPRWLKGFDAPLDRFILRQADYISVHTETFQQKLINNATPPQKVVLTKQFFDMEIDSEPIDLFQKDTINLFYAGAFYKNIRNPKPFLDAFLKTPHSHLRFFIAGNLEDCQEIVTEYTTQDSRIVYLGFLERPKVLNMLKQADYVVNFCNKGDLQLPSKLQELTTLNPQILNLYEHESQKLAQNGISNIPHTTPAVFPLLQNLTKPKISDEINNPNQNDYQEFVADQTQRMLRLIQGDPNCNRAMGEITTS